MFLRLGYLKVTVTRQLRCKPLFCHFVTISHLDINNTYELKGINVITGIISHRPLLGWVHWPRSLVNVYRIHNAS